MVPMIDEFASLKERLLQLDVSCLCDTNKQLRVLDSGIRPLQHNVKFVGRAHTVTCYEDFLTVIKGLHDAAAGDVLVVDAQNSRTAVAGELFTSEAGRKGLAAIVIDGACRDSAAIRHLPTPVYARAITPMAGTTTKLFQTQIPVTCGGVVIHPGDILFGDDDGIVVVSMAELADLLPQAEAIQATENKVLARIVAGESLFEMVNYTAHEADIRQGKASRLSFLV